MRPFWKGKEHKNTNEFCLKVFGNLHILMQTVSNSESYFWRYCDFIFFKMAAHGGSHFDVNIKTENYKTLFISQKDA